MELKKFFIEEIGVPEGYWGNNKLKLREISGDAVHRYMNWLYGYKKYDRGSFEVTMGLPDRLERKDECLGFLSKEILESELQDKPMVLKKLTALAFKSPEAYNYPIMDVLDYLNREEGIMEIEHPEWFVWKDTLSKPESYENMFERTMKGNLADARKIAVFVAMVVSLKERKREDLSRALTTRFFESSEIPYHVRKRVGESILEGRFFGRVRIGAHKDAVLATFEKSSSAELHDVSLEDLQLQFEIDSILKAGQYLERIDYRTRMQFSVEKKEITRWLLNSIRSNEAKAFIGKWLGKKYEYHDFPVVKGIIDFLKEWGKTNSEFTRKAIDGLKNANRYQVRKLAFEAGHDLFGDGRYLEEAKQDSSKKIREWAAGLK